MIDEQDSILPSTDEDNVETNKVFVGENSSLQSPEEFEADKNRSSEPEEIYTTSIGDGTLIEEGLAQVNDEQDSGDTLLGKGLEEQAMDKD